MSVIEVNHLTKFYGRVRGVEDLNFSVQEGEIFGFLGPNGAGKTTTIRLMLDFIRPNSGSIRLLGLDASADGPTVRRQVGYVSAEPFLYPFMRGQELLHWLKSFRPRAAGLPLYRLQEILKFDAKKFIKSYSSGNRKKLAFIQAVMHRPKLLILDEPTNGLDPIVRQDVYAILRSLRRGGTTIFFSSHDLTEVQKLCDRVAIIKDGRIVAVEPVHELIGKSALIVEVTFAESPAPEILSGMEATARNGHTFKLRVSRAHLNAALERLNQAVITDLTVTQPTLEDIFLEHYR